jgi:hypothetical protein
MACNNPSRPEIQAHCSARVNRPNKNPASGRPTGEGGTLEERDGADSVASEKFKPSGRRESIGQTKTPASCEADRGETTGGHDGMQTITPRNSSRLLGLSQSARL